MSNREEAEGELIETEEGLERVLKTIAPMKTVTVDTEFLWERTYYPKLALVQVAGRDADGEIQAFAVDPLVVEVKPLFELLAREDVLKVMHAGRLDQQIAVHVIGAPLGPVFDTQRGASLLGLGAQVGYGNLVEVLLGRKLKKGEQYTDWTRRPLRASQIEYALLDVVPLVEVYETLRDMLSEKGRLDWALQEMGSLSDPSSYDELPADLLYTKIKRYKTLDRRGLGALQRLASWRDHQARARDWRPTHVIQDQTLVQLASRRPGSVKDLYETRGLHAKEVKRSGEEVIALLREAERVPEKDLPTVKRTKRPAKSVGAAVDLMRAYLAQRCEQHGVAVETVVTSAELERLARDSQRERFEHDHPVLQGWRGELVGEDLQRILRGELSLGVDPSSSELRLVEGDEAPEG